MSLALDAPASLLAARVQDELSASAAAERRAQKSVDDYMGERREAEKRRYSYMDVQADVSIHTRVQQDTSARTRALGLMSASAVCNRSRLRQQPSPHIIYQDRSLHVAPHLSAHLPLLLRLPECKWGIIRAEPCFRTTYVDASSLAYRLHI